MSAMLAIVLDTWRQSRRQVVFMILLVILLALVVWSVAGPVVEEVRVHGHYNPTPERVVHEQGTPRPTGPPYSDEDLSNPPPAPAVKMEEGVRMRPLPFEVQDALWETSYGLPLVLFPDAESADLSKRELERYADKRIRERRAATLRRQRDLEAIVVLFAKMAFTLSMVLFVAACAGYFPGLLQSGAIDVVLARPLGRAQVFFGKFLGGLFLYTAAITGAYTLLFLGLGLRFGSWQPNIFLVVPVQVLSAAVLFAVLAFLGVLVRSSALPLMVGLLLYLGVDTALEVLIKLEKAGVLEGTPATIVEWAQVLLPNFGLLKDAATSSVFGLQSLPTQPLATAVAWLAIFLGLGYARFYTADY